MWPTSNDPAGYDRRKALSLFSYGLFILGVALGGMIAVVIFSLLSIAQKGDAHLEQLEMMMRQRQAGGPGPLKDDQPENRRAPAGSDLNHGDPIAPRILISRWAGLDAD
jgi:hypothetical protein